MTQKPDMMMMEAIDDEVSMGSGASDEDQSRLLQGDGGGGSDPED